MARTRSLLLAAPLLLAGLTAGCAGQSFEEPAPLWKAGYRWEWALQRHELTRTDGDVPAFLAEELGEARDRSCNETRRLEIFNATAESGEGIPLYAGAWLTQEAPNAEASDACGALGWDPQFFTRRDLNPVRPVRTDLSEGLVRLSDGDGQPPADEERMFRFPLRNGASWVERSGDDDLGGATQTRVVKKEARTVPAGRFDAVRIFSRFVPDEAAVIEREIRAFFASQGSTVETLEFDFGLRRTYWYAAAAAYLVDREDVNAFIIHAAGRDGDGASFDFTFQESETTTERLVKFELTAGLEQPLAFLDQLTNYRPPPITPLAHFVAEAVVSDDGLNAADEDPSVTFGLRVFNTTAGEKRLRPPDDAFPVVGHATDLDTRRLAANWTFARETPTGLRPILGNRSGPSVDVSAEALGGPGRVQATVTLIDKENRIDLSTDTVWFEVYWSANVTVTATTDNVTARVVNVSAPVDFGALVLAANVTFGDATGHPFGVLRARDAAGQEVDDEDAGRTRFRAALRPDQPPGTWDVRFQEPLPVVGGTYQFDVAVRYRDVPEA